MNGIRKHLRKFSLTMAVLLAFTTTFSMSANAGMVGTGELIQQQQVDLDRQQLLEMLEDQEVKAKLQELGVSDAQVEERIQNLTPTELAEFEQQLAEAPTGEGVVGIIVLFLLVFIITDMLCATDLFPFVKCIR
ncbi:PA2779 family protein [Marinobacter sp. bablab_jr008]|uniref:PA2779 family protein n=1 Tax=Marinobacter sp. bablab_jr008 TaxID=2755064 RepID=UPI0018F132D4|nr:PA2779 family protein [Marinobacter sp. bablab_jr008]MEC9039394.1 PA2779 family protein [Pseudomonadota bacterium]MEC9082757.1 PA2779 family protein [Pseudomonadota bacterium]MEC9387478.1 PA2779 family protein [Pseudomonadota bacterium]